MNILIYIYLLFALAGLVTGLYAVTFLSVIWALIAYLAQRHWAEQESEITKSD